VPRRGFCIIVFFSQSSRIAVSEFGLLFVVVWLTLMAAPPAAFLIVSMLRWKAPATTKPVAITAGSLICVYGVIFLVDFRFTQPSATIVCAALTYGAYCILTSLWFRRSLTLFGLSVAVILALPILSFYALGITGMPLVAMVVGDITARPLRVQDMGDGLVCNIVPWGSMGVSGYNTALFRTSFLPFLERKVAEINVTEQADSLDPASCMAVLSKYSGR
jgi:hypothetical protein